MRILALATRLLPPVLALVFAACGDDDGGPPAPPLAERAARIAPPAATAPPPPDAGPPPLPWVGGAVLDATGAPVVGRSITVVDRRGRQSSVMSDEGGTFWVADVATPYDVAVAPAPSGAVVVPTALLGLARRDPRIVLDEPGDWSASPTQTFHFRVVLPPCPAGGCWVSVVTSSSSGRGDASRAYGPEEASAVIDVFHRWRADPDLDRETVDVFVLAGDAEQTAFAFLRSGEHAVAPGEVTDLGAVAPAPIATSPPVMITMQAPATPFGWQLGIGVDLLLPGGASLPLRRGAAPSIVTPLPSIPGATFRASASASAPRGDEPFHESSSRAWSGPLPIGTPQVLLDLPAPVVVDRPDDVRTISRRGRGVTWSRGGPGLAVVDLFDLGRVRHVFHVLTDGDAVSFARLDRLGVPGPALGAHLLDVTTRSSISLDDRVGPCGGGRDEDRAGEESHERVALTVMP